MTTPNARVILPAEATVEMIAAFWRQKNTGTQDIGEAGDATSDFDAYTSMLAASSASGKVTEAEVSVAYAAAKEACEGCTSNFCGDCDCDGFTCGEGIRAALASLGLELG